MSAKARARIQGTVLAEFAVISFLLISSALLVASVGFREELRQNMIASAMGVLNDPYLSVGGSWAPFTRDPTEQVVPFSSSDACHTAVVTNYLDAVASELALRVANSSTLSGMAEHLRCMVQLGYLAVDTSSNSETQGRVRADVPPAYPIAAQVGVADPADLASYGDVALAVNASLKGKLDSALQNYVSAITGAKVSSAAGLVQLSPDSAAAAIIFPYHAFMAWGCAGDSWPIGMVGGVLVTEEAEVTIPRIRTGGSCP